MMAGESGTSGTKGVKYCYYKCGGAKRKLGCKRKPLKKYWIERAAVLVTVDRVLKDAEIDRMTSFSFVKTAQVWSVFQTSLLKSTLKPLSMKFFLCLT